MHDLQSVLLWKSCESFAWLADTAAPQFAQTSPDCGALGADLVQSPVA